jgi:uncharacterized protein
MKPVYVETSALLRGILEGKKDVITKLTKSTRLVTSTLTLVEATRALRRALRDSRKLETEYHLAERRLFAFERSSEIMNLNEPVLARARQDFPQEPIRTLDALHVASALVWQDKIGDIQMVSCDDRVRQNAAALGLDVWP